MINSNNRKQENCQKQPEKQDGVFMGARKKRNEWIESKKEEGRSCEVQ